LEPSFSGIHSILLLIKKRLEAEMTYQDHIDPESTPSTCSTVTTTSNTFDQAHPDLGQVHGVVSIHAAKQFTALNEFHQAQPGLAAEYNGNTVTADYRDLLTRVVDNFQDHCFATGKDDIPITFTRECSVVKTAYRVNGRQIIGDLFAMDNVFFDLTRLPEGGKSITMYAMAGSVDNLCLRIGPSRYMYNDDIHVSPPLQHDKEQGLDAFTVSINSENPPIFTTVTKQGNGQQETYVLHKHGDLTDFAKTESNRAVYRGTGFFTATISQNANLNLELVGTRIFGKSNVLPVPWKGNSAGNVGI
jgi:hypothetical protein